MKRIKNSIMTFLLTVAIMFSTVSISAAVPNNRSKHYNMPNKANIQKKVQKQKGNFHGVPTIKLNGQQLSFDVSPRIENGRTLVPIRTILAALGAQIQWDNASKTVIIVKDEKSIKLTIGQKTAYKNGVPVQLDVAVIIINGRTMVPLRFISEVIGANVEWDETTGIITISLSDDTSIYNLHETLTDYFADAGDDYFDDNGIDVEINLSGDEDDLAYKVTLDFDDTDEYDNLTDLSKTDIEHFLNAVKAKINAEINGTDYEDADITGKLIDNNHYSYYVKYDGSSYIYSWDDDNAVSDIEEELQDYFADAGDDYFDENGIDVEISLSGDEDDLAYKITLDFDDADEYDNLTDLSETDIERFLNAVKTEINTEIDGTDYEDADITGKLIDNNHYSYYVKYNGNSYIYSWD